MIQTTLLPTTPQRVETAQARLVRLRELTGILADLIVERGIWPDRVYAVRWGCYNPRYDCEVRVWTPGDADRQWWGFPNDTDAKSIRRDVRAVACELGLTPMFSWYSIGSSDPAFWLRPMDGEHDIRRAEIVVIR